MADIFREVDEEVRKDKAEQLWKKYGIYVIVVCVALVAGTGGRVAWQKYDLDQRTEQSNRFVTAVQLQNNGELEAAITSFASLAEAADEGYSVIARLREGAARAANNDLDGARVVYEELAADGGADDLFRDLARLQAVLVSMDSSDPSDLRARLEPLAEDGMPWRYSARELLALVKYRGGDIDGARTDLQALMDDGNAPPGMSIRIRETLAAIGAEG